MENKSRRLLQCLNASGATVNTLKIMKPKLLKQSPWGPDEYFLVRRANGRIEVKDGRSLEEYINDPRMVKARKKEAKGKEHDYVCCGKSDFLWGRIPRMA